MPFELEESVDISDLIEHMQDTFVLWGVEFLFSSLAVQYPFFNLPLVNNGLKWFLKLILGSLSKSAVVEAFFVNTAIRKASQAQDYILALAVKKTLSLHSSEEEYEMAERNELAAFRNFVRVTN